MKIRAFLLAMLWAMFTGLGQADYVNYTVTSVGNEYLYSFTLTNEGATGLSLHSLVVTVPDALGNIDTGSVTSPLGWGGNAGGTLSFGSAEPGTSFVSWGASQNYVPVGQSLGGFTFLTNKEVSGPLLFDFGPAGQLQTLTTGGGGGMGGNDAPVSGLPEPGSLALFGLVLFSLLALRFYGKRRGRSHAA